MRGKEGEESVLTQRSYAVMYDFDNLKKGVMSDHIREVLEKVGPKSE